MIELLHSITNIQPPFNMIVLIILIATGASVVTTIIKQVGHYARHQEEISLKQDMVDRGMSAAEIAQVMQATVTERQLEC